MELYGPGYPVSITPYYVQEDDLSAATQAAKTTYTADDLLVSFLTCPITETTVPEDLPDAAWLMSVGIRFAELAGCEAEEVVEKVARHQALLLQARADGSTAFVLAQFLIDNSGATI